MKNLKILEKFGTACLVGTGLAFGCLLAGCKASSSGADSQAAPPQSNPFAAGGSFGPLPITRGSFESDSVAVVLKRSQFDQLRSLLNNGSGRIGIFSTPQYYVGCFSCSERDPESIFNKNGYYGQRMIGFPKPDFVSVFSQYSMCNSFASNAPALYIQSSFGPQYIGRISINSFGQDSICNTLSPFAWDSGCRSIKGLCGEI